MRVEAGIAFDAFTKNTSQGTDIDDPILAHVEIDPHGNVESGEHGSNHRHQKADFSGSPPGNPGDSHSLGIEYSPITPRKPLSIKKSSQVVMKEAFLQFCWVLSHESISATFARRRNTNDGEANCIRIGHRPAPVRHRQSHIPLMIAPIRANLQEFAVSGQGY